MSDAEREIIVELYAEGKSIEYLVAQIERMQLAIDDMVSIACRPHDLPDHYSHETRLAALVVKFIEAAMRHEHLASPEARRGECPIVVIDG